MLMTEGGIEPQNSIIIQLLQTNNASQCLPWPLRFNMTAAVNQILNGASQTLYHSVQRFSNQFGVFAERLDEIGAQVFSADVSFDSVPSPAPSSPPLSPAPSELALPPSSAHIVLADGELVAKPGIHSLPMELLHLIVLHMLPDVDTINKIGTINRTWYLLSRDVHIWNDLYKRRLLGEKIPRSSRLSADSSVANAGVASASSSPQVPATSSSDVSNRPAWSLVVGPVASPLTLQQQQTVNSSIPALSSSPTSNGQTPRRPSWFTPTSFVFNQFTATLFTLLETYRRSTYFLPPNAIKEFSCSPYASLLLEDGSINFESARKLWWIQRVLYQSRWNVEAEQKEEVPSRLASLPLLSRIRTPVVHTLPVFGPGVRYAHKALFDYLAHTKRTVEMMAGVRGIGAGIGLHFANEGMVLKLSAIHDPPQPFSQTIIHDTNWNSLFASSSAFIYVVGSNTSLDEAKADLQEFLLSDFGQLAGTGRSNPIANEPAALGAENAAPPQNVLSTSPNLDTPVWYEQKSKKPLVILSFAENMTAFEVAIALGLESEEIGEAHASLLQPLSSYHAAASVRSWAIKQFSPTSTGASRAAELEDALRWLTSKLD